MNNPIPKNHEGETIIKSPRKPSGFQPLLRCHCLQMQWSYYNNTCPLNCNGDAACEICNCTCQFVWAMADTCQIQAAINSNSRRVEELSSYDQARATTNKFLNDSLMAGQLAVESAVKNLSHDSSEEQMNKFRDDAFNVGRAQFIASNKPPKESRDLLKSEMVKLQNPKGPGFIRTELGVDKNLRTDGNYLNKYWQDQIWLPPLYFSNTRGNAPLLGEDSMTVEVLQQAIIDSPLLVFKRHSKFEV